jgi:cobalt/nickel transport system ATP-binding protein
MQELLTVNNLSFSYPDGQRALDSINLGIYRGDSIALVGPNGAGKSTLVLHFNGILRSDGHVKLMGKVVNDSTLKWVRSKVGLVFQNPDDQLFSPTVFDDVAFGPMNMGYSRIDVEQAVLMSLESVGMSGFEKRSPHHLSVGEKKRIAMATVLSMSPEVMVIDEPTANLDPRGKWDIIEVLKNLSVTKILVTHDLEMVEALCHRMVIINRGRVVIDGLTVDILADKQLLIKHGLAAG